MDTHNWLRCRWRSTAARAVAARRPHFGEAHVGVEWVAAEHVLERSGFSPPRQVAARLPRACPHCAHPEETAERQLWHCPRLDAVRLQAAAPFGVDPIPSAPQTRAAHPPFFVEATLPQRLGLRPTSFCSSPELCQRLGGLEDPQRSLGRTRRRPVLGCQVWPGPLGQRDLELATGRPPARCPEPRPGNGPSSMLPFRLWPAAEALC